MISPYFSVILMKWYAINKRDLPWRKTNDPYKIWLSEIMLQQTRVEQGMPYYLAFESAFPTIHDLANAGEEEVLKLWQGLGYYSRARNLHFTAKFISKELKGVFPGSYKELLELKGVGDYTASAIASICYEEAVSVVDGNVYRVLSRYFGVAIPINSTEGIKYFKKLAFKMLDVKSSGTYNQAIMEFGAKQCKPKSPNCTVCPLNDSCVSLQKKLVNDLPVKLKKVKVKNRFFNYLVFRDALGNTLMNQRKGKGIWQELYEFPLVETTNTVEKEELLLAVNDELIAETNISMYNDKVIIHKLSHQHIHTRFWIVEVKTDLPNGISTKMAKELPVPILIANFITAFGF